MATRDKAHLSGWDIIVSDNVGYLHVLFEPPPSARYPNWIRLASTASPLGDEAQVPAQVLRHGTDLLRSVEEHEQATKAAAAKKSPAQIKREVDEILETLRLADGPGVAAARLPRRGGG